MYAIRSYYGYAAQVSAACVRIEQASRITSYNVCYTKLLRVSPRCISSVPSNCASHRETATETVITSYSIHYTKLYESVGNRGFFLELFIHRRDVIAGLPEGHISPFLNAWLPSTTMGHSACDHKEGSRRVP